MDFQLRRTCSWVSVFAGVVAVTSVFSSLVHSILLPTTIFVAGTAVFLFLRILFGRNYRRGIDAAIEEMRAGNRGKRMSLTDPDWGLFGRRVGPPALLWLRAVLVLGIVPLAFLKPWIGADVVLLWFAGGFVATELSLMHLAQSHL